MSAANPPSSRRAAPTNASRTIVLLYPRAEPDWPDPAKPLGLPLAPLTVARTLVRAGYDVRIVDENADLRVEATLRRMPRPLYVGISCIGGGQLRHGMRLARLVARLWPGVPRVWGGWNPTLLPELYERDDARAWVDVVVRGRGEATALALARALERGADAAGIAGVSWWDARGAVVRETDAPFEDPSDAELLPYELIGDMSRYIVSRGMVNYISSYGCPHRCAFCGIPSGTRTFKYIEPPRVAEQLRAIRELLRVREVLFLDDNFFTLRARVVALAEALLARRGELRWHSNGRIEQIAALSDAELALLARSGCTSLNAGYETGDQRVADRVHKDTDVSRTPELARRLHAAGIRLSLNFMVGLPGEDTDSLYDSLNTLEGIHAVHPELEVCWYMYMPAPATELWDELIARGVLARPRSLVEHARLQPYGLEHPWYYVSPPRDVWLESRTPHKRIAWNFYQAYAASLPTKGPRARLARWLRERCKRRHVERRTDDDAAWAAAYAWHRTRTLWSWSRSAASRRAWLGPIAELAAARADPGAPATAGLPVTGVHRST